MEAILPSAASTFLLSATLFSPVATLLCLCARYPGEIVFLVSNPMSYFIILARIVLTWVFCYSIVKLKLISASDDWVLIVTSGALFALQASALSELPISVLSGASEKNSAFVAKLSFFKFLDIELRKLVSQEVIRKRFRIHCSRLSCDFIWQVGKQSISENILDGKLAGELMEQLRHACARDDRSEALAILIPRFCSGEFLLQLLNEFEAAANSSGISMATSALTMENDHVS